MRTFKFKTFFVLVCLVFMFNIGVCAANEFPVTYNNFANVETNLSMEKVIKIAGGVNKFAHIRKPTPIENQQIIRMNRDTLYSLCVVDVSEGAKISIPKQDKRYISMAVINSNGYTNMVEIGGGDYTLNKENVHTDYALIIMRIFIDSNDAKDVEAANKLQDLYKIDAVSNKALPSMKWDMQSYDVVYTALLELFKISKDANDMFGPKELVDPAHFLIGTAGGFGGLPSKNAVYYNYNAPKSRAIEFKMTLKDVPVNAFWSFTVYDKNGYLFKPEHGLSNVNSSTAKPNSDKSFTLYFGMCEEHKTNCLGIKDGWNGILRLYEPQEKVLNHTWEVPNIVNVND